jgi:hypothetical protein
LSDADWRFHRTRRSEIWINPEARTKGKVDGKVRSRSLADEIMKDAGLGKKL